MFIQVIVLPYFLDCTYVYVSGEGEGGDYINCFVRQYIRDYKKNCRSYFPVKVSCNKKYDEENDEKKNYHETYQWVRFLILFTFLADLEPLGMIGAGYLETCYKSLKPRGLLWEILRMSNTRYGEKVIDLNRKYIHDISVR